jgi:hypothetical protein
MAFLKCPKCRRKIQVQEYEAGDIGQCPDCGQKFRLGRPRQTDPDAPAGRPTSRTKPDDELHDQFVPVPKRPSSQPPPPQPKPARQRSAPPAVREEEEEEEGTPYEVSSEPAPAPPQEARWDKAQEAEEIEDDDPEPAVPVPVRRRKKRKKVAETPAAATANLVGFLVMLGITVLTVAGTGTAFLVKSGAPAGPDMGAALAALEALNATIQRDLLDPSQPVIGISLAGRQFKNADLANLAAFPKLKKLDLSHSSLNSFGMDYLERLTSLEELNIASTKVNDSGLGSLRGLTNLKVLNLTNLLVTDRGLESLDKLTNLERLYLGGTLASGFRLSARLQRLQVIQ